jgi:hypothetical protein
VLSMFLFLIAMMIGPSLAQDAAAPEEGPVAEEVIEAAPVVEEAVATKAAEEAPAVGDLSEFVSEDVPGIEDGQIGTGSEAFEVVQLLVTAAKAGQYGLAVALGLSLLVWVIRTFFWSAIPKEYVRYASVAMGAVLTFAGAMVVGLPLSEALFAGLGGVLAGLSAVGLWELILKKVMARFQKKEPESAPSSEGA